MKIEKNGISQKAQLGKSNATNGKSIRIGRREVSRQNAQKRNSEFKYHESIGEEDKQIDYDGSNHS